MHASAAVVACALLAVLALFQLALALGVPWGGFAWGGQHEGKLPAGLRVGSALSIILYALIALVLLDRSGLLNVLPDGFTGPGAWVLFGYFALGTAMNAISRSRDERLVMTPLALALAICALLVALN